MSASSDVTIRIEVIDAETGQPHSSAAGSFVVDGEPSATNLGEVALEAAQALAEGRRPSGRWFTRGRVALRELARSPQAQLAVTIGANALRTGAAQLEARLSKAAAALIADAPPPRHP